MHPGIRRSLVFFKKGMDEHGGTLKIAQLDQSVRSISKEMGVKLFTWGDKLEGWLKSVATFAGWRTTLTDLCSIRTRYEDQDQHFGFGPTTYLFGE